MLLSEAILLGSIGTKQAFGSLKDDDGGTCALGAALTAVGFNLSPKQTFVDVEGKKVSSNWGWMINHSQSPVSGIYSPIQTIILALNDVHRWPRPQIAAWVAEQEVKLGIVDQVEVEVKEGVECKACCI
jgi:hypothetical protein